MLMVMEGGGYRYRCDGDGCNEFSPRQEFLSCAMLAAQMDGWELADDRHLCHDCFMLPDEPPLTANQVGAALDERAWHERLGIDVGGEG